MFLLLFKIAIFGDFRSIFYLMHEFCFCKFESNIILYGIIRLDLELKLIQTFSNSVSEKGHRRQKEPNDATIGVISVEIWANI